MAGKLQTEKLGTVHQEVVVKYFGGDQPIRSEPQEPTGFGFWQPRKVQIISRPLVRPLGSRS